MRVQLREGLYAQWFSCTEVQLSGRSVTWGLSYKVAQLHGDSLKREGVSGEFSCTRIELNGAQLHGGSATLGFGCIGTQLYGHSAVPIYFFFTIKKYHIISATTGYEQFVFKESARSSKLILRAPSLKFINKKHPKTFLNESEKPYSIVKLIFA